MANLAVSVTVLRHLGNRIGTGRSVVVDLAFTGGAGDDNVALSATQLKQIGLRRIDYIEGGNSFIAHDETNSEAVVICFNPTSKTFFAYVPPTSIGPFDAIAADLAGTCTARVTFVGV